VADVLRPPYHPYTELLLRSVPVIGTRHAGPPAMDTPTEATASACRFAARCVHKLGPICDTEAPPWQQAAPSHHVRCHIPLDRLQEVKPWLPVHARITEMLA
jgi:peptide/nickel transport system ATP-binding protein